MVTTIGRQDSQQKREDAERSARQEEFREWVERDGPALIAFFGRRLSREIALDLTQETFLRAYRNFDTFRGESSRRTWLLRIANNVERMYLRDSMAAKRNAPLVPLEEAGESVESTLVAKDKNQLAEALEAESAQRLNEAIRRLPPRERLAIQLFYLEGLSVAEVAKRCDVYPSTIKSQLQSGKRRLRAILGAA